MGVQTKINGSPEGRGLASRIGLDAHASARRTELRLPADLPLRTWAKIGSQIALVSSSSAWWLGDWLVYGRDNYPDRYKRAMKESSLDYQTLRNYAWVAGRFEVSRRRDALSFQHHAVVAALPQAEQEEWLDRASSNRWSLAQLRRELREAADQADNGSQRERFIVHIDGSNGRYNRWEAAARAQDKDIIDWAVEILDQMAARALNGTVPHRLRALGAAELEHAGK